MFMHSIVLVSLIASTEVLQVSAHEDPDFGRNFSELVCSKGFVPEEHYVVTEDQYILGVFRVKCRKNCCPEKVIYISTPLFMDSDCFVADYANNSLAYLLADNGFDVWIGNIRGTKYSRAKVGLPEPSSSDYAFYDYTFIDAALKDIPAGKEALLEEGINHVLKQTNQTRVFYIGHSQATAGLFALLSVHPEWNKKIIAMVAMCPFRRIACDVGQDGHYGGLANVAHNYRSLNLLRPMIGSFPPANGTSIDWVCRMSSSLCSLAMHINLGHAPNLNHSRLEVYTKMMPAPTSLKNLVFFGQMSSRSCNGITDVYDLDYDDLNRGWTIVTSMLNMRETNLRVYGRKNPPRFHAEDVQIPVRLYYGENDGYATASEAEMLSKELPDYRGSFNLGRDYGHWDLIMPTYNASHVDDAIHFMEDFVVDACKL